MSKYTDSVMSSLLKSEHLWLCGSAGYFLLNYYIIGSLSTIGCLLFPGKRYHYGFFTYIMRLVVLNSLFIFFVKTQLSISDKAVLGINPLTHSFIQFVK